MSESKLDYFIGVDVGGTSTDAVLLSKENGTNEYNVLLARKAPTSVDVSSGIVDSLKNIVPLIKGKENQLIGVFIGTTTFVNAIVENSKELSKVFVIRLAGQTCDCVAPFETFPSDLRKKVEDGFKTVQGGHSIAGTEIHALDESQLKSICDELKKREKLPEIVVIGTFSATVNAHELTAEKILKKELGDQVSITLSHRVGAANLLKRENTAILNACLRPLADQVLNSFRTSLDELGLTANAYVSSNDGSVLSFDEAKLSPVFTLASGPTNSLRGAAFLTNSKNVFVLDVGGTTTDIGYLDENGSTRQTHVDTIIGGVLINATVPDVRSIALGGGTKIDKTKDEQLCLGVQSVGHRLKREALVFGGNTATMTDVAAVVGNVTLGDANKAGLLKNDAEKLYESAVKRIENSILSMKIDDELIDIVLVGGGASLFNAESLKLSGVRNVIVAPLAGVANAIGAVLADVSATVDQSMAVEQTGDDNDAARTAIIDRVKSLAIEEAVRRGAAKDSVRIVDVNDTPLAYSSEPMLRVRAKASGVLAALFSKETVSFTVADDVCVLYEERESDVLPSNDLSTALMIGDAHESDVRLDSQEFPDKPTFNEKNEWILNEFDLNCIAIGAGVLGCGGGGTVQLGLFRIVSKLKKGKEIRVFSPKMWKENNHLKKDEVLFGCAFFGAPMVIIENIGSGKEIKIALENCLNEFNNENKEKKKIGALMSCEAGGTNAIEPMVAAVDLDVPILDADGMGRAFPQIRHYLPFIVENPNYLPACLVGNQDQVAMLKDVDNIEKLENQLRDTVIGFGGAGAICLPPLKENDRYVSHSISKAHAIGRAVLIARKEKLNPVKAIVEKINGKIVFLGNICDVKRGIGQDFTQGFTIVNGVDEFKGKQAKIHFQNENLAVLIDETPIASVPDLISIVERDTARPVYVDELNYGLRIAIVVLPCHKSYRDGKALSLTNPKYFKLDFEPVLLPDDDCDDESFPSIVDQKQYL